MNSLIKKIIYIIFFSIAVLNAILIYSSTGKSMSNHVGWGLIVMYVLIAISFIAALLLAVKALILNPNSGKMVAGGILLLLILLTVGYFIDGKELLPKWKEYDVVTKTKSGLIGGSLIATWFILAGAVGLTLFASVADFIKRL